MANVEDEQLSSEESLTLRELRNTLAQMNLPIPGTRSVLIARQSIHDTTLYYIPAYIIYKNIYTYIYIFTLYVRTAPRKQENQKKVTMNNI